jgi:hypothetical protein
VISSQPLSHCSFQNLSDCGQTLLTDPITLLGRIFELDLEDKHGPPIHSLPTLDLLPRKTFLLEPPISLSAILLLIIDFDGVF